MWPLLEIDNLETGSTFLLYLYFFCKLSKGTAVILDGNEKDSYSMDWAFLSGTQEKLSPHSMSIKKIKLEGRETEP